MDGEEVSSTAIRARIRKLIAEEESSRPLSDSQLAEILAREGVKVARRTVAKYREALGLAASSERRLALARARA
jgi:RNA polymerase sigma-54 factor